MKRVLLDTNVYIDWLNLGAFEELLVGPGLVRYLSAVVAMELRTGARTPASRRSVEKLIRAYAAGHRVVAPTAQLFVQAGAMLGALAQSGREIRRASLVNDVLIALSARSVGATVITKDASDFSAIAAHLSFKLEPLVPS
jgi:predicted nucleic acid-binding protein